MYDKNTLILFGIIGISMMLFVPYSLPAKGQKYAALFSEAERLYGLPKNLLARVAYQESHFRSDIISGALKSKSGAVGIMQIIPRWHPGVNPLDPIEAIPYAAKYLKELYNRFGSWNEALAAYNWGPGNLSRFLAGEKRMPLETKNYVNQIMTDIFRV